ncbi:SAM-dependent methyltransferase [Streptomyces griseus]|uniref:SAM-dependent methyltransferase n=1 Tax=Streptomyces griseus TaxID=1911 RepID=UPI0008989F59|nr:SAM-dependent methyltransferase [Streptomyces griseus]SEE24963.1 hypothetical protein SAMN04490359_2379 [Streptomyces griseus]
MQISKAVCRELELAHCNGPTTRLRKEADPATAEAAHKVLTRSGACWSVRQQAYVFADLYPFGHASKLITQILARRHAVNRPDRGIVSCPQSIAELLWSNLPHGKGMQALEPSAGHGALAAEGAALGCAVDCYEIDDYRAADITRAGIARHVTTADFLTVEPQPTYDVVAMYPPHRRDLAAKHILHAHRFLRPGGVLGALVSLGIQNTAGAAGPKLLQLLDHTHVLDDIDLQDGYLLSPTGLRMRAQLMYIHADDTQA